MTKPASSISEWLIQNDRRLYGRYSNYADAAHLCSHELGRHVSYKDVYLIMRGLRMHKRLLWSGSSRGPYSHESRCALDAKTWDRYIKRLARITAHIVAGDHFATVKRLLRDFGGIAPSDSVIQELLRLNGFEVVTNVDGRGVSTRTVHPKAAP